MARNQKEYSSTRSVIVRAADAILFRADPPLSREKTEDSFVLRSVLNELVWKYSEATPLGHRKYESCEWWSKKALNAYRKDKAKFKKQVQLEHVKPRKELITELTRAKNKGEAHAIFESIITCVVLRTEHKKLKLPKGWKPSSTHPEAYWERYRGIVKRAEGPRVTERGPTRL